MPSPKPDYCRKFYRECVSLTKDAIEEDNLDVSDINGWPWWPWTARQEESTIW